MNDENLWHPDDPVWMAERKKEWRNVKRNLDRMTLRINKRDQKYHKEYFFYGKKDSALGRQGGKPFGYSFPLFQLWYAPILNEETIQTIYKEQINSASLTQARDLLFNIGIGPFGPDYGMMGGREEMAVKMLFPGLDWQEKMYFSDRDSKGFPHAPYPSSLSTACLVDSGGMLQINTANPFSPGQYLWDHLDYAYDNYFELITDDDLKWLQRLMRFILDFEEREGAPRDVPTSVALKEKLETRFEAGGFCQPILDNWDDAKRKYAAGDPPPFMGRKRS